MRKRPTQAYQQPLLQAAERILVTMYVTSEHPLMVLKKKLDWPAIRDVVIRYLRLARCNVDRGPGRPLNPDLYIPLIVLQLVKNLHSRAMEEYLAENAVARVFIDWEHDARIQVRDHSNIARITEALGEEGLKELNALVLGQAVALGFADRRILSGDTTAQELPIGFPHEAGIMQGLAQRCQRALAKLRGKGKRGLKKLQERFAGILLKAKEYHLFAKTKEEKQVVLHSMVRRLRPALREVEALTARLGEESDRVIVSASGQLHKMLEVGLQLVPQVLTWLQAGKAVKGRLLHPALTEARAIARNKAGKKWEYGMQYLIGALGGGYLFAELLLEPTGEVRMPEKLLVAYHENLDVETNPEMLVYDRGGWSKDNARQLQKAGIKVGIQPKGRARWRVHGTDRKLVQSERAQMEGKIGTLKTEKYGFNKPKQRKAANVRAAGQRSVLSFNLNKMMRDMVGNTAVLAQTS